MTFIVAEIGINHNGSLSIAKDMILKCKQAGADAVKFQKRTVNVVYTEEFLNSKRESPWGETQRAQKEGLELGESEYSEINDFCELLNIPWFASAWDIGSQLWLRRFNLRYNKVASAMLNKKDFLNIVAEERKHTFISTGMAKKEEIDEAVAIFRKYDCPFELLHCVSTYPMDVRDANLGRMKLLREEYDVRVGYSGHEVGLSVSLAAIALGASIVERHVTLDRAMYGSDQSASLEIQGLERLIKTKNEIELAIANCFWEMRDGEKEMAKKLKGTP